MRRAVEVYVPGVLRASFWGLREHDASGNGAGEAGEGRG